MTSLQFSNLTISDEFEVFPAIPPASSGLPQPTLDENRHLVADLVLKGLTAAPNLSPLAPCFVTLPLWLNRFLNYVREHARRHRTFTSTCLRLDHADVLEALVAFANSTWKPEEREAFESCQCQHHDRPEIRRYKNMVYSDARTHCIEYGPFHETVLLVFSTLAKVATNIMAYAQDPLKVDKISKKLEKWPPFHSQFIPHGASTAVSAFINWSRLTSNPAPLCTLCRLASLCPELQSPMASNEELLPLMTSQFSHFVTSIQHPETTTEYRKVAVFEDVTSFFFVFSSKWWIDQMSVAEAGNQPTISMLTTIYNDLCDFVPLIDQYIPPSPKTEITKELFGTMGTFIHEFAKLSTSQPLHPELIPYTHEGRRFQQWLETLARDTVLLRNQSRCSNPTCTVIASEINLKRCAGCGVSPYCSKECQAADWRDHRPVCKPLRLIYPKAYAFMVAVTSRPMTPCDQSELAFSFGLDFMGELTHEERECVKNYFRARIKDHISFG